MPLLARLTAKMLNALGSTGPRFNNRILIGHQLPLEEVGVLFAGRFQSRLPC